MKRLAAATALGLLVYSAARLALDVSLVSWARVRFPLDLDWIEGGQLAHALRILEGRPIYGAAEFLPHPYPPLHYLVLAAVGSVAGLSLTMGRLVSVAMWLLTLALGAAALYRAARGARSDAAVARRDSVALGVGAAIAGVGLALRTYPYADGWFDLARSDTLLLALVAAASACACHPRGAIAAGLLLAAALFVKQTAVFFVFTTVVFVLGKSRREAAWLLVALLVPSTIAFAWLDSGSGGAFRAWIFSTSGHPIDGRRLIGGIGEILAASPHLVVVPLAALALRGRLGTTSRALLFMWLAAVPASLLPYGKMYGAPNNLVPLLVVSAFWPVSVGLDVARAQQRVWLVPVMAVAAAALIAAGRFEASRFTPSETMRQGVLANLAAVKALPGTIACPVHPFLAHQLKGQAAQSSWLSFIDARAAGRPVDRDRFVADLLAQRADWIVLTNMSVEWEGKLQEGISDAYAWDHNFETTPTGRPDTFHSMPRMAFRRRSSR